MDMPNQLDLFTGEVNEHVAHVYARLPRTHAQQKITGRIRGPFNAFAQTLPANATFQDLGPGDSVLARAVVTDPCTWSPESPALYHVTIQSEDEQGRVVEYKNDYFGIRRFGVRGKDLFLDGRRWVARGFCIDYESNLIDQISKFHEQAVVQVLDCNAIKVPNYGYDVLEAIIKASEFGVAVIINASNCSEVNIERICKLSMYPSVFMVTVGNDDNTGLIKKRVPNVLIAQYVYPSSAPATWADIAWIPILAPVKSTDYINWKLPVIAYRRSNFESFTTSRAACDQLQADLAPLGQFAGYVV